MNAEETIQELKKRLKLPERYEGEVLVNHMAYAMEVLEDYRDVQLLLNGHLDWFQCRRPLACAGLWFGVKKPRLTKEDREYITAIHGAKYLAELEERAAFHKPRVKKADRFK